MVQRDAALAGEARDPQRLRRYLRAVAANSAGVVEHKTLYDAAGVNRLTAVAYDELLEALSVWSSIPAHARSGSMTGSMPYRSAPSGASTLGV